MIDRKDPNAQALSPQTQLVTLGRDTEGQHGFVNPAVYHGSTVLFPDVATLKSGKQRYTYGRRGSPTSDALENALTALEGSVGTVLTPSGMSAVALSLMSVAQAGDHILVVDSAYRPTRLFCDTALRRFGIEVEYYDPHADVAPLLRENTRAILLEAPGSQTFEMQDVPSMVAAARTRDVLTIMDNTWASPLLFQPIAHGVDVSVQAGTKYIVGHSDVLIGTVSAGERAWPLIKTMHGNMGLFVGPDDVYLALRGLRTLSVRLKQHQASATKVARWLAAQPQVARVLYPALESDPGHAIWRRDFKGASGLFGVVLNDTSGTAVAAFLDNLRLFGLGYSWGGFESLAIPCDPTEYRTARPWTAEGALIRLHIGLEDPDDLIADLAQGLERLHAADAA